ncbi:MAG: hypothetical protein Q8L48_21470 [Archangium sp.]|nr:hypothetical protein [Archangium sp.]
MPLVRVLLGLSWGLVLSGLGEGAGLLIGEALHHASAIEYFGTATRLTWADVGLAALKALGGGLGYALAAWLGWWFTSPRIHEHRGGARIAMVVGAVPGALSGLLTALFLGSVMK